MCVCVCVCVWLLSPHFTLLAFDAQINLIAPPAYVVTTTSLDKEKGIVLLRNALEAIRKVITQKQGSMQIKFEPRAVTETDERELTAMMEKYERENQEVGGDDDGQEEEDTGMGGPDDGTDAAADLAEQQAAALGDGVDEATE
jgi:hypothetical protein